MTLLAMIFLGWLIAGIGTAAASSVWYVAQRPDQLDTVDAVFITCVALVVVAVWPIVVVAVAVGVLLRRLQAVSYPELEANG